MDFIGAHIFCNDKVSNASDEQQTAKYLHCFFKKLGLWNDITGFELKQAAEILKTEYGRQAAEQDLKECHKNLDKKSPEQWIFNILKCFNEKDLNSTEEPTTERSTEEVANTEESKVIEEAPARREVNS